MSLFLLKISKSRWNRHKSPAWLPSGDVPAKVLLDLRTANNGLSVWYVKEDRSNLDEVLIALASAYDRLDNLDYALFEERACDSLKICVETSKGTTPARKMNQWHRDLTELSGEKVLALAKLIYYHGVRERKWENEIQGLLKSAVASGAVEADCLKDRLAESLGLAVQRECPNCKSLYFVKTTE
jgi:hypothetical protein